MLIPQFTIRWLLGFTTLMAVLFSIVSLGMRGHAWAGAIAIMIGAMVLFFLVHFCLFGCLWVLSLFVSDADKPSRGGPAPLAPSDGRHWPPTNDDSGANVSDPARGQSPFASGCWIGLIATAGLLSGLSGGPSWAQDVAEDDLILEEAAAKIVSMSTGPVAVGSMVGTTHSATGAGLSARVHTVWVHSDGYRPISVVLSRTRAGGTDRSVLIRVTQWSPGVGDRGDPVVTRQWVDLPAGTPRVSTTVSLPPCIGSVQIELWEDGKILPRMSWSENYNSQQSDAMLRLLYVGPEAEARADSNPLIGTLDQIVGQNQMYGGTTNFHPSSVSCETDGLPERWLDYSGVDLLAIRLDQLKLLQRNEPTRFEAVVAWTVAGGTLLVGGVDSEWVALAEIDAILQPASPMSTRGAPAWAEPNAETNKDDLDGFENYRAGYASQYDMNGNLISVEERAEVEAEKKAKAEADVNTPFRLRRHGWGMIVALACEGALPESETTCHWLLNELGTDRWLWCNRHGLSVRRQNDDFWNFLVPGVDLNPVGAFLLLITLFVLAIGPLNYWILRRSGRLHWMMITVPVGAMLVTGCLFSYALIRDGLSTRVRSRSITWIDQTTGRTASWARLSYYAGLAPSDGMTMSSDAAVLPLEFRPRDANASREMEWDDQQYLGRGWLASRTPVQYMTVRSSTTEKGLEIDVAEDGASATVRNGLGTRIEQLVIRDANDLYFTASAIEAGASVKALAVADSGATSKSIRAAYLESTPVFPENVDPSDFPQTNRRYSWRWYNQGPLAAPTSTTSLLERTLSELVSSTSNTRPLSPSSYVALVARPDMIELGVDEVAEEASFHLIAGKWQ